jgi:hypothetical protein
MVDESGTPSGEDVTLEPTATVTTTRPRALWGVLAAVAVAAGALVVTSSGGDDAAPQLPVALGASGGRSAEAAMSADMALGWVTYVAGEGLPVLGGEAPAYRLTASVDEARVRNLADALGLSGDPAEDDGFWHLESDGAVLEVYEADGTWWYSANQYPDQGTSSSDSGSGSAGCEPGPAVDCAFSEVGTAIPPPTTLPPTCEADTTHCLEQPVAECGANEHCTYPDGVVEPCAPDASCTAPIEECPPSASCAAPEPLSPRPPADLPSEDEARGIALDLLSATGMDLDDSKVTVDGPYDAWYVSVEPRLDGVPVTGWMATAGVGAKGAITSANGTLATAERLGDYPLIDTRAAVDRLNELQSTGFGGVMPLDARDGVAQSGTASADSPVSTAPCTASDPAQCDDTAVGADAPTTTVVSRCKTQPDGSEICEQGAATGPADCVTILPLPAPQPACPPVSEIVECVEPAVEPGTDPAAPAIGRCIEPGVCYDAVPPADDGGVTDTTMYSPECADPVPYPEPEPVEIVLTEAERVLVLLPSVDGTGESYLVPGYRFSNDDGAIVEVAAVADESLAPTTTVPETNETTEVPTPPSTECEALVEDDGSGTTHTVNPCPPPASPEVGVAYPVEVIVHCAVIVDFDGRWWSADDSAGDLQESTGTLTLTSADDGTFTTTSGHELVFHAQGPSKDYPGCD